MSFNFSTSINKNDNKVQFEIDSNHTEDEFYSKIPPKTESSCFSDYFDNLSNEENLIDSHTIQSNNYLIDDQSTLPFWKDRRKCPKFLNEFYLLGDTIGRGSYGKVKDCVDVRTMRRYAVKIVHRMKIKKIPGGMKHVENEITLMKMMRNKNIVRLVDDFREEEPERRCLVMEFCLGSIHDLQTNGIPESANQFRCLPEWQTRRYFIQIVDGLEYLHDKGLIHRDMKPGNFLLTEHDCVKITDFGVSERLSMFQLNSLISGGQTTPAIQPPELANGASNVCGFKLDIYGTGVSLYFMLCGNVPFSNPNILLIFDEIAAGNYTIPDWVSDSASDLIRNMMRKDVNERFDIKKIKSHCWYLDHIEEIGEMVDPKIYLAYTARDHNKKNHYKLSTGVPNRTQWNEKELPAIMPLTVTSRLRTYYNWPMIEDEENTEIDQELIIGEDFLGMDINTYESDNNVSNVAKRSRINSEDNNESHTKVPTKDVDDRVLFPTSLGDSAFVSPPMPMSSSQSAFGQRECSDRENIFTDTKSLATSSNDSPLLTNITKNSEKKSSNFKSKLKMGCKIPRCTQS